MLYIQDNTMPKIKDLPIDQRPREKMLEFGPESLSDAELLAVLIGHGVKGRSALGIAEDILSEYGKLSGLVDKRLDELMKIKGIKKAKVIKIATAFELAKRIYFS